MSSCSLLRVTWDNLSPLVTTSRRSHKKSTIYHVIMILYRGLFLLKNLPAAYCTKNKQRELPL